MLRESRGHVERWQFWAGFVLPLFAAFLLLAFNFRLGDLPVGVVVLVMAFGWALITVPASLDRDLRLELDRLLGRDGKGVEVTAEIEGNQWVHLVVTNRGPHDAFEVEVRSSPHAPEYRAPWRTGARSMELQSGATHRVNLLEVEPGLTDETPSELVARGVSQFRRVRYHSAESSPPHFDRLVRLNEKLTLQVAVLRNEGQPVRGTVSVALHQEITPGGETLLWVSADFAPDP